MRHTLDTNELRAELARRGWRQADLAEHCGVSLGIAKWVCRGAWPSKRLARRILDVLGPEAAARICPFDNAS